MVVISKLKVLSSCSQDREYDRHGPFSFPFSLSYTTNIHSLKQAGSRLLTQQSTQSCLLLDSQSRSRGARFLYRHPGISCRLLFLNFLASPFLLGFPPVWGSDKWSSPRHHASPLGRFQDPVFLQRLWWTRFGSVSVQEASLNTDEGVSRHDASC